MSITLKPNDTAGLSTEEQAAYVQGGCGTQLKGIMARIVVDEGFGLHPNDFPKGPTRDDKALITQPYKSIDPKFRG